MESYEDFVARAKAGGFDEILVREWAPNQLNGLHQHPFDTHALVVKGEFWLTIAGTERHISVGQYFDVARGIEHEERYGPEGATFWAARRN